MTAFTKVRTDLGTLAVGFSERGISRVTLSADWSELGASDLRRHGLREDSTPPRAVAEVAKALQDHIAGRPQDFSAVALDTTEIPPFLLRVQRAAQAIPVGQTSSYSDLAKAAGSPSAARAAGRAMSSNPWPIIVPCHRVLPRIGFGGYSAGSGVPTKLRLLWREGYRGRTSNVAFDEHAAVEHLRQADARLGAMIDRVGPFTLQATAPNPRGGPSPFVALARAIVFQQLAGKVAATIYARVAALMGADSIDDPRDVLGLSPARLRAAGLSENKARALTDLARHAQDGSLPSRAEMQSMADEDIIAALTRVRGIGRWSAQMLLLFHLGRPNVLPVADLGVQKGFAVTYGARRLPSAKTIERAARTWAPYAGVASWYLWRAVEVHRYDSPGKRSRG